MTDYEHDQTALIAKIVQSVAELPNRTSPDDWPEAMLVTADELSAILVEALRHTEDDTARWMRSVIGGTLR